MEQNHVFGFPPHTWSPRYKAFQMLSAPCTSGAGLWDSRGPGREGRRKHRHTWAHTWARAHARVRAQAEEDRCKAMGMRVCTRAVGVLENHTNETEPPRATLQTRFYKVK